MTQAKLADAVEYTDRSMISHVEAGRVDLTRTMIMKFAEALKTTPEWLMGWDDPAHAIAAAFIQQGLDEDEARRRAESVLRIGALSDTGMDLVDAAIALAEGKK